MVFGRRQKWTSAMKNKGQKSDGRPQEQAAKLNVFSGKDPAKRVYNVIHT